MDEGGCQRVENDKDRFEDESIIAAQLVRKLARTEQKQAKLGVHSFLMVLAGAQFTSIKRGDTNPFTVVE